MNDQEKTKPELIEELQHLQQEFKVLQAAYNASINNRLAETTSPNSQYNSADTVSLLKAGIDSTKDMIILFIDKSYRYLYFNPYHKEVMIRAYGISVELDMNILECITNEDDRSKAKINYDRALSGECHTTIEEYGDIERAYWETRYSPIFNEKNEIIGATAFSMNITQKKKSENALKESSKRFKIAIDNFPYEFIILDPQFKVLYLNKLALCRYPKSFSEVVGSYLNDLDDKSLVSQNIDLQNEITINKKPISKNLETRKAGQTQYAKITYVPFLDESGSIKEIFRISIDLTNTRKTETQLRALSNQLEKSREEERHRISRDIHDDLGQILTVLKIDLESLETQYNVTEKLKSLLDPIIGLVDSAIDSARRVSFELRPAILDQTGLIPAMQWLLNESKRQSKIEFVVAFPEENMLHVDTETSVTIYRIFQEILTNISRHSNASKVNINLQMDSDFIELLVSDNGLGFDLSSQAESLGLLGMQERARIQNGDLLVQTGLKEGTSIKLVIPIKNT